MRVNGKAFRKAREKKRMNSISNDLRVKGKPLVGTQEWLAQKAQIRNANGEMNSLSVRTIQYLEKGNASLQVIDAVSAHLGINGRELIYDYGHSSINLSALRVIDFRPQIYPAHNLENFHESPLLISIDPLCIDFNSDDLDHVKVKNITATLITGTLRVEFKWLYFVSLTPDGKGWLGIEGEAYPFEMSTPQKWIQPIMLNQINTLKVSWQEFLSEVEVSGESLIKIEVDINFVTFSKKIKIGVAVSQINNVLKSSPRKYPFYLQPEALQWDSF